MNYNEIEKLIEKITNSDISLFELNIDNVYLKMDKSLTRTNNQSKSEKKEFNTISKESYEVAQPIKELKSIETIVESKKELAIDDTINNENTKIITSPMVGTFYSAPGNKLDEFVKIGQLVKVGETLCIIEAMKLMNEIEADIAGEIVEILVENGQMVEFGTELFRVRS